jgi:hypothetical protein
MLTLEELKKNIETIVKGSLKDGRSIIIELKKYFENDVWPSTMNKQRTIEGLNLLINGNLPEPDPGQIMMDLMFLQSKKPIRISSQRKHLLEQLRDMIQTSKDVSCNHEKLVIAPFLHGGGFTPIIARPELICLNCGLNITLGMFRQRKNSKRIFREEHYGLRVTNKKELKKLFEWCGNEEEHNGRILKNVRYADDITKDPKGEYEKSANKWLGQIPFEIIDKEKLEALTGR